MPRLRVTAKPVLVVLAIACGALSSFALRQCSPPDTAPSKENAAAPAVPVPAVLPSDEVATETAIRFYAERVKRDPEETRSLNALSGYYLQRVRESGNEDYLPLALEAARASLAAVAAEQNLGGLTALAHAEFSNHDFAAARDHALQLAELRPQKSEPYAILGDACLELGEYERAIESFRKMEQFGQEDAGTATRLARLEILRGDPERSRQHLATALSLLRALQAPPRATIAWCQWQLGEIAIAMGDYKGRKNITGTLSLSRLMIFAPSVRSAGFTLRAVICTRRSNTWASGAHRSRGRINGHPGRSLLLGVTSRRGRGAI